MEALQPLFYEAVQLIHRLTTTNGILASTVTADNYKRIWARDSVVCGFAGILIKDEKIIDGVVQDDDRLAFLKNYFEAAHQAISDGVNLKGYFVWSLMDNFEWLWGYSKRFGLIRVEYKTQERTWKKSAYWYQKVIAENGFNIDE